MKLVAKAFLVVSLLFLGSACATEKLGAHVRGDRRHDSIRKVNRAILTTSGRLDVCITVRDTSGMHEYWIAVPVDAIAYPRRARELDELQVKLDMPGWWEIPRSSVTPVECNVLPSRLLESVEVTRLMVPPTGNDMFKRVLSAHLDGAHPLRTVYELTSLQPTDNQ